MNNLIPTEFYLGQNYPNPFSEKTIIKFCIAYKTRVKLTVYNSTGDVIKKLIDEVRNPGTYEVEFNSHSDQSRKSENEIPMEYYYKLEAGDYKSEKGMILL
jgi:hypothetical protein